MLQVLSYTDKCTRYLIFIVKKNCVYEVARATEKILRHDLFSFLLRHILKNPQIEIDGGEATGDELESPKLGSVFNLIERFYKENHF